MGFPCVALLCLFALSVNAAVLDCDYKSTTYPVVEYICVANITITQQDRFVDQLNGNHIEGKQNNDLTTVVFMHLSMETLPKNLRTWFINYSELAIVDVPNYPSLRRSHFYEFTHLTSFYARELTNTKVLPKDTFWDLPKLKYLFLDGIVNLENLHSELLVNARSLRIFSARGPNKITQIGEGFFRNQFETLEEVDFRGSNLVSISHSVFVNLLNLHSARFYNSGCLKDLYKNSATITTDVRAHCQDVLDGEERTGGIGNLVKSKSRWSNESSE